MKYWGTGEEVMRVVSIFEHPNHLAFYLAPLIGFFSTLWLNRYQVIKNRWVFGTGILILMLTLFLTFSRGAWLALAIGLILIIIKHFGLKKTFAPLSLGIIILAFIPAIQNRLNISDASSSSRLELMEAGLNKITENPIFGNGLFGFRTTLTDASFIGEIHNYPHNLYLALWLELGLLGLFAFAWIIKLVWEQYQKKPDVMHLAAISFILIVLIHGLVDTPYFKNDLSVLFWFMLSLFYQKS
jgi:O-antigen ligase